MGGKMSTYLQDPDSLVFKSLKFDKIGLLVKEHVAGKSDNYKILFSLVAFEEWLRCN
jgi:hypothetical protein